MRDVINSSEAIQDIVTRVANNDICILDRKDNSSIEIDVQLKEVIEEYYTHKVREY